MDGGVPLEVAAGAATMFMSVLLSGRIIGLFVDPSTLSFCTICVLSQPHYPYGFLIFYIFQKSNAR